MRLIFEEPAWEQYLHWIANDRKTLKKINEIIADIDRTPYDGIGKPEQLKHDYAGWWSRRIDQEHRLTYRVDDDSTIIVQCRFHYYAGSAPAEQAEANIRSFFLRRQQKSVNINLVPKLFLSLVALTTLAVCLAGCGGALAQAIGGATLPTPTITGITPNPVTRGQSISITGTNLNGTYTTVYFTGFGTATSGASSGNTTSVVAYVPTNLSAGPYTIYVITTDANGDVSSASNSVSIGLN